VEEIRAKLHNGEDPYNEVVKLLYSLQSQTTVQEEKETKVVEDK
jgi:hypothetical protein